MNIEHSALVIIDAQNGFVNERSSHVIPVIADLVARWQDAGGATIFTLSLIHI